MKPARTIVPGLLLAAALLAAPASGQQHAVLTGIVLDDSTGEPISDVHVFIARSTIGAVTDAAGRFALQQVPFGAHRLYLSRLGYEPLGQDLLLRERLPEPFTLRMTPATVPMPEITVEADRDRRWKSRLRDFERLFIGETSNAEHTLILNPHVLHFERSWGRFRATAAEPLIIENRALGYRITYFLADFEHLGTRVQYDGEPLYEPMKPSSPEEARRWEEARMQAYAGSMRHFLRALQRGTVEDEGFVTYIVPTFETRPYASNRIYWRPERLVVDGDSAGIMGLRFGGALEVIYLHAHETWEYVQWSGSGTSQVGRVRHSWLTLNERPAFFDEHGSFLEPYAVTQYGYFAFMRIAEDLPKDFDPEEGRRSRTRL
jgi:hypothetical protein